MSYQDELLAKLAAAHATGTVENGTAVDAQSQEEKILEELDGEFAFSRYDLDESDILRTLKILDILEPYQEVFRYKSALRLFYAMARIDVITPKNLHAFAKLPASEFKTIINSMAKQKLLFQNENGELELTLEGKHLAARIGLDIFL